MATANGAEDDAASSGVGGSGATADSADAIGDISVSAAAVAERLAESDLRDVSFRAMLLINSLRLVELVKLLKRSIPSLKE